MVARLIEPGLRQIVDFCGAAPVERVFLEDVARRKLGRFTAVEDGDGGLRALCHVGANVVPAGRGCGVFAHAAARGRARMVIGAEEAVDELWDELEPLVPPPRDDRPGQPVYELDRSPEPGGTALRPATREDLELLVPAAAAAHEEEIGVDPLAGDAQGFRWRTQAQVEEGRSWLWLEGSTIRFKAEASAWTPHAVQLQQVWVDPVARGRGDGSRGLRDLCRLLLATTPVVCLFVRPENEPALRLYESIGMRRTLTFRSLIF